MNNRKRREVIARERVAVARRYGLEANSGWQLFPCHWCGEEGKAAWNRRAEQPLGQVNLWGLEWDHLMPHVLGGPDVADNLVWACCSCNMRRGSRFPVDWLRSVS